MMIKKKIKNKNKSRTRTVKKASLLLDPLLRLSTWPNSPFKSPKVVRSVNWTRRPSSASGLSAQTSEAEGAAGPSTVDVGTEGDALGDEAGVVTAEGKGGTGDFAGRAPPREP